MKATLSDWQPAVLSKESKPGTSGSLSKPNESDAICQVAVWAQRGIEAQVWRRPEQSCMKLKQLAGQLGGSELRIEAWSLMWPKRSWEKVTQSAMWPGMPR